MPVVDTKPSTAARPCSCVSRSTSPSRQPAWARAIRVARVHPDAAHQRHVEHQRAVADREAGDVVAAALDREQEAVLARERDAGDDVGHAEAARDRRRPAVDHRVPDRARRLVARRARTLHRAAQAGRQRIQRICRQHGSGRGHGKWYLTGAQGGKEGAPPKERVRSIPCAGDNSLGHNIPRVDEHFFPNAEAEAQGRTARAVLCRLTCGSVMMLVSSGDGGDLAVRSGFAPRRHLLGNRGRRPPLRTGG